MDRQPVKENTSIRICNLFFKFVATYRKMIVGERFLQIQCLFTCIFSTTPLTNFQHFLYILLELLMSQPFVTEKLG